MPTTKPTLATPAGSGDGDDQGETVILGSLPSDTHGTRVAHPRPVSIAPTATAGGDAVPSTHTPPEATQGPTASTESQRQPGPLSFTATNRFAVGAVVAMTAVVLTVALVAVTIVDPTFGDVLAAVGVLVLASSGQLASSKRSSTDGQRHSPSARNGIVRIVR